jgi:hypothetical protein
VGGLILVALLLLQPVVVAAQGLGDAAARERQKRRAQPSKPARAITQEDLDAALAGRGAWTSPDGAFRVAFAGQPEVKDESGRGAGTTYRLAAGTNAYLVNVRSQPPASKAGSLMDEIRDAALSSLAGATLVGENSVTTPRGIPGRQFLISFSGRGSGRPGVMRSRAYVSGGRTYLVTAVVEAGSENAAEVVAFFDSLEILK